MAPPIFSRIVKGELHGPADILALGVSPADSGRHPLAESGGFHGIVFAVPNVLGRDGETS